MKSKLLFTAALMSAASLASQETMSMRWADCWLMRKTDKWMCPDG